MKKPKTVEGWLKTLPEPLRSSALNQVTYYNRKRESNNLSYAILWVTTWAITEEGEDFWYSFFKALEWAESKEG